MFATGSMLHAVLRFPRVELEMNMAWESAGDLMDQVEGCIL